MSLENYWLYEDIDKELSYGDLYTIYLVHMFFRFREYIGDFRSDFSYQQLQAYYNKYRHKITPKTIDIPKWTTIARRLRKLSYDFNPPLFLSDKKTGFFTPSREFWMYVEARRNEYNGYFWSLKRGR